MEFHRCGGDENPHRIPAIFADEGQGRSCCNRLILPKCQRVCPMSVLILMWLNGANELMVVCSGACGPAGNGSNWGAWMRRTTKWIWVPVFLASAAGCSSLEPSAALSLTGSPIPDLSLNRAVETAHDSRPQSRDPRFSKGLTLIRGTNESASPSRLPTIRSLQAKSTDSWQSADESIANPDVPHPLSANSAPSTKDGDQLLPPLPLADSWQSVSSAKDIVPVGAQLEVDSPRKSTGTSEVEQLSFEHLAPREFPENIASSYADLESGSNMMTTAYQEVVPDAQDHSQRTNPGKSIEPVPTPADLTQQERRNSGSQSAGKFESTNSIFAQKPAVQGNSSIPTLSRSRNPIPNLEIYLAGKRVTGNGTSEHVAESGNLVAPPSGASEKRVGPKIIEIPTSSASSDSQNVAAAKENTSPIMELTPVQQTGLPPEPAAANPIESDTKWTRIPSQNPAPHPLKTETAAPSLPSAPEKVPAEPSGENSLSLVDCCEGLPENLIPLVKKLESLDPYIRVQGLEALAECGQEARSASPAVHYLMEDPEPVVSIYAAFALREIAGDSWKSVATLSRHLHDSDEQIVRLAAYLLGRYGPEAMDAVVALNTTLKASNDLLTQLYISEALIQIFPTDRDAVAILTNAIRHPDADIRWFAAMALGHVSGPMTRDAVVALISGLRDNDQGVQQASCLSLASIGRDARLATPELLKLCRSDTDDVRFAAETALACLRK